MKTLLLIGEPMGLFTASTIGPLENVDQFTLTECGAELNVAIGVTRLGQNACYMTRLGSDPVGCRILARMKRDGISTQLIRQVPGRSSGVMMKGRTENGDPETSYFRKGSAASTLCEDDADAIPLVGIDRVHITGALAGTSQSASRCARRLMIRSREAGIPVSFDPNLRPALWESEEVMRRETNALCALANLVLPGISEGERLTGQKGEEAVADYYLSAGADQVVIKMGANGAYTKTKDGDNFYTPGYVLQKHEILDTVGAGDGFAAGVLSSLMEGCKLCEAVKRGCAIGAIQLTNRGDNEGLPDKKALIAFEESHHRTNEV